MTWEPAEKVQKNAQNRYKRGLKVKKVTMVVSLFKTAQMAGKSILMQGMNILLP